MLKQKHGYFNSKSAYFIKKAAEKSFHLPAAVERNLRSNQTSAYLARHVHDITIFDAQIDSSIAWSTEILIILLYLAGVLPYACTKITAYILNEHQLEPKYLMRIYARSCKFSHLTSENKLLGVSN